MRQTNCMDCPIGDETWQVNQKTAKTGETIVQKYNTENARSFLLRRTEANHAVFEHGSSAEDKAVIEHTRTRDGCNRSTGTTHDLTSPRTQVKQLPSVSTRKQTKQWMKTRTPLWREDTENPPGRPKHLSDVIYTTFHDPSRHPTSGSLASSRL